MTMGNNSRSNVIYMAAARQKKKLVTPASGDLISSRLRSIWEKEKAERGFTQKKAAKDMGIGQTMVSHYLSGHKTLGVEALLRFCKYLRCRPTDVIPNWEFAELLHDELSPDQVEVARLWDQLPLKLRQLQRDQLKGTVQSLGPRKT